MDDNWDDRIDAVWADDSLSDADRITVIDALAAELAGSDSRGPFERAGARDSAGREADAEKLYRRALSLGLDPLRRSRATIQLASTIRNLGNLDESLELRRHEYEDNRESPLHDAAAAFYALALASSGDATRATSVALTALAPHLPRYTRSVTGYAADLIDDRR